MPKQIFPAAPGYNGTVYSDEVGGPTQLNLNHLTESFQIADLLRQLGHTDAAECIRPVRLLGGFRPMQLVDKLRDYATQANGPACIACVTAERLPEFVWNYDCSNAVNTLVRLKLSGGFILGILAFHPNGGVAAYPENGPERELHLLLLNTFARGYAKNPEYQAAEELLNKVSKPESFEPQNAETTLDIYSEWCDEHPTDIHKEITIASR